MKLTDVLLSFTFLSGLLVLGGIYNAFNTHHITVLAISLAIFLPLLALSVPRARAEKETWRGW